MSEIELALNLPETDVTVEGADQATHYVARRSRSAVRLNLNGDNDFDFVLKAPVVDLFGGEANDVLDASAGQKGSRISGSSVTLFGFGGSDRLITGGKRDGASGGPGADLIDARLGGSSVLGGSGSDRIVGGPGYQLISAGLGDDRIDTRGGGTDEIDCGPGDDLALVDKKDTGDIRECERVRIASEPRGVG